MIHIGILNCNTIEHIYLTIIETYLSLSIPIIHCNYFFTAFCFVLETALFFVLLLFLLLVIHFYFLLLLLLLVLMMYDTLQLLFLTTHSKNTKDFVQYFPLCKIIKTLPYINRERDTHTNYNHSKYVY